MVFSSFEFVIFFTFYLVFHFIVQTNFRVFLIILGSLFFYSYWEPVFVVFPLLLTFVSWIGGYWLISNFLSKSSGLKLPIVITILLIPLTYFKYSHFLFVELFNSEIDERWLHKGKIPIGISFITFTAIAYVVEVKRQTFPVEKEFKHVLQYILFFPQLIAGPILRPAELLSQLKQPKAASSGTFLLGSTIFIFGLVKKVIFADQIARVIDPIWSTAESASLADTLIAVYGFSVQIYMDFSGYTDMAIGLALILGVSLPSNFRAPYASENIIQFWRRWHITLSNWLRDFVYIPLGGNKKGKSNQTFNILITMVIGGLWHGAGWNFLIWGGIHGSLLAMNHMCKRWDFSINLPKFLKVFITFNIVTFAWIFFRAENFTDALYIIKNISNGIFDLKLILSLRIDPIIFVLILFPLFFHKFDKIENFEIIVKKSNVTVLVTFLTMAFLFCMLTSYTYSAAFIYFDF